MLIDTHSHLSFSQYDDDRQAVLDRIRDDLYALIEVSVNRHTTHQMLNMFPREQKIYYAVGFHPHYAHEFEPGVVFSYRVLLRGNPRIKALGEIGLDVQSPVPMDVQLPVYERMVRLGRECEMPVVVHNRGCDRDILKPLEENALETVVFHCYSSDRTFMETVTGRGWHVSFAGNITFKNAHQLREAATHAPLGSILVETDCPYLAPQRIRGQRNDPTGVRDVIAEIARLKNMPVDELEEIVLENAKKVFDI